MRSSLQVFDNFFTGKAREKLDYLYAFFKQCNSNWQLDFIDRNDVLKKSKDLHTQYVKDIIKAVMKCYSNEVNIDKIVGYEAWINTMPFDSKGLEYHFDCDEGAENLVSPLKSLVVYLGPAESMTGGNLALDFRGRNNTDKKFKSSYNILDDLENGWIQVPFEYGRVVSFDPKIPHAVLPIKKIKKGEARITLTIAVWDKEPAIIKY